MRSVHRQALLLTGLAALVGLSLLPVLGGDTAARPQAAAAKARLKSFGSCASLVSYARRHAPTVVGQGSLPAPPSGRPVPVAEGPARGDVPTAQAPAQSEPDYSRTNVQEAGIDEPDIVKSDGSHIFAVAGGKLHAVDARPATPRLVGSVSLEGFGHELFLRRGKALVISIPIGGQPVPVQARPASILPPWPAETLLTEVDVRNPAAMRVLGTQRVEGSYVSARLNGPIARVVISSTPRAIVAAERDRAQIKRSSVRGWTPSSVFRNRRTGRTSSHRLVPCREVRRPATFSGLELVTVLTVDLARGLPAADADTVMGGAQTVYASAQGLYVATQRWIDPQTRPERLPEGSLTAIHKFNAGRSRETGYRASGEVRGVLLSQWSLSEHRGYLRVASTDQPSWWGNGRGSSESFVTVLDERSGRLAQVGRVGRLGRGERIYAVRFIDDVGYVVTFRQIDPLYTLDLSKPTRPRVAGELKVLGYSAYLHPIGRDLLLGVGQDATAEGRLLGTQLSLFDVSNPREPRRLHQLALESGSSTDAEYDHHAFLYWPPSKLAVLPVSRYLAQPNGAAQPNGGQPFQGAIGFRVDREGGISQVGKVSHDEGGGAFAVRRAMVVGGRLFTLSEGGLVASDLGSLGKLAWVSLPAGG